MREEIKYKKVKIKEDLEMTIFPLGKYSKLFEIDDIESEKYGEATIQILEAKRYEYELSNNLYQLKGNGDTCFSSQSKLSNRGTITPGNYVGTLELFITKEGENEIPFYLEVLATKFNSEQDFDESYRRNYRFMIESITEKCTELLMQANSPVNQYFESDFNKQNKTLYQRFSFIKSIVNSNEFEESVQKIITSPKTNWINQENIVDIRSIKRFTNKNIKGLLKGNNRISLPKTHNLYLKNKLKSIPLKINSYRQEVSVDNPENRFIKHALQTYLQFCEECKYVFKDNSKDQKEAEYLTRKLGAFLNNSFFKYISRPITLKLNSPSLQRKSGYRQVLKSWLMFDLASKLTWLGGEDIYKSGKRDIATLYEYWLFFILYDLFKEKFQLNQLEHEDKTHNHLFEVTKDGLNLIIKSGQHTALSGSKLIMNRVLNIKFSFNRTFSGSKNSFPKSGSWTTAMRPDYTLSVWPAGLKEFKNDKGEKTAEEQEKIIHIHFDAKYKVNHFKIKSNSKNLEDFSKKQTQKELDNIKKEERAGVYKNADLLKMHAYKDAIRRTGGAYILYPGNKETRFKGFHELIPGLGAFSLNPANQKKDILALSNFIDDVIEHLVNRASQRENIAIKSYKIHKKERNELNVKIPESIIPDDTFVLVGFHKGGEHYNWIRENELYNIRTGVRSGAVPLNSKILQVKYILLYTENREISSDIWKVIEDAPNVYSQNDMENNSLKVKYINPDGNYIVFNIKKVEVDFDNAKWDISKLIDKQEDHEKGAPFAVTLTELMKVKITPIFRQ